VTVHIRARQMLSLSRTSSDEKIDERPCAAGQPAIAKVDRVDIERGTADIGQDMFKTTIGQCLIDDVNRAEGDRYQRPPGPVCRANRG
jgi:hypothetical protein